MTGGPVGPDELTPTAVVLTQVAAAEALAAACALSGVAVDAVPTDIGAVAVPRATVPGEAERVAQAVSQVLRTTRVVLLEQRAGRMTASRWEAGARRDELPAALMLDGAPPEVEALLLGRTTVADLPGTVTSVGLSRWRALRRLRRIARGGPAGA